MSLSLSLSELISVSSLCCKSPSSSTSTCRPAHLRPSATHQWRGDMRGFRSTSHCWNLDSTQRKQTSTVSPIWSSNMSRKSWKENMKVWIWVRWLMKRNKISWMETDWQTAGSSLGLTEDPCRQNESLYLHSSVVGITVHPYWLILILILQLVIYVSEQEVVWMNMEHVWPSFRKPEFTSCYRPVVDLLESKFINLCLAALKLSLIIRDVILAQT